jgi:hypothetical protein
MLRNKLANPSPTLINPNKTTKQQEGIERERGAGREDMGQK